MIESESMTRKSHASSFEKKYLSKIIRIVNEKIVSVLLRVGGDRHLMSFLEYINTFLSWFLSSVESDFDE